MEPLMYRMQGDDPPPPPPEPPPPPPPQSEGATSDPEKHGEDEKPEQ